ncbi:MAG: hypothetical protein RLY31_1021 [Bacteroidota bacterium]|jgi:ATP-binding cassette subfamily B protein
MKKDDKQAVNYSILWKVVAQARPYRVVLFTAILLAMLLAPLSIIRPYIVQSMVDDHIFRADIPGLTRMAGLFMLILLVESGIRYVFMYSSNWVGQAVVRDLRVRIFDHITSLRLSYFDRTPIGISTTRTISDIENINQVFSQGIITILADFLTVFVVLGVMFWVSWKLTLACLLTMPFLIVATFVFKESIKSSFQQVRAEVARMNAFLQERLSGMRIVQIFQAEEQEMENFKRINRDYTSANIRAILAYSIFYPVVEVISAASLALMVWYGAQASLHGEVSPGALVAFPLYLNMLFRPIRMLADKFNTLQMGLVAAERVFSLLERQEHIQDKGTLVPQSLKGRLSFHNVWFAYHERDWVLKDISFRLDAGQTLALVGSTGSGKTSIISILGRLYDIQQGRIEVDGHDIRDYRLNAFRSRLAVVLQDVFLFSGSVLENITLRNTAITHEQVVEAAKAIGAHTFIEQLPGGYDYQVMERGATLSMGQRQLISFVRALVFDPDILILDEATSSIDPESEAVIQHAIETLIAKRTSIIIAHRLSTIRHADKILLLDKGEVREFGTHEELLRLESGKYRELYEMQFLPTGVG